MLASGTFDMKQTGFVAEALWRTADAARQFVSGLMLARMARAAADTRVSADTRVRYTADAMLDHAEDGLALAGALEGLETALAHAQRPSTSLGTSPSTSFETGGPSTPLGTAFQEPDATTEPNEAAATIERRARELRSDLRFLLRADD